MGHAIVGVKLLSSRQTSSRICLHLPTMFSRSNPFNWRVENYSAPGSLKVNMGPGTDQQIEHVSCVALCAHSEPTQHHKGCDLCASSTTPRSPTISTASKGNEKGKKVKIKKTLETIVSQELNKLFLFLLSCWVCFPLKCV